MQKVSKLISRSCVYMHRHGSHEFFCQQILLFIAISLLNYTLYLDLLCLYIFTAFKGVQFIYIIPVLSVVFKDIELVVSDNMEAILNLDLDLTVV